MPRPNQPWAVRIVRKLDQLRHRREVEWLALYLGAAWIIYEVVGLTVDTFGLAIFPDRNPVLDILAQQSEPFGISSLVEQLCLTDQEARDLTVLFDSNFNSILRDR